MSALRGTVLGGVDEALPYDAVFRIEVSLSSQTTSVIVMRTTARLYCLQGAHSNRPSAGQCLLREAAVLTSCACDCQVMQSGGLWHMVLPAYNWFAMATERTTIPSPSK
jgi:hypothetical protein